ncbi:MAG: hypothetical protein WDO13_00710 [Verrucomicrobiota bacterium]
MDAAAGRLAGEARKMTSAGFLVEENFRGRHYGRLVLYGDGAAQTLLSDESAAQWNFPKDRRFRHGARDAFFLSHHPRPGSLRIHPF